MWNAPTEKELSQIPQLYTNEGKPIEDVIVHEHFFIGGCDWFVTEFDGEDLLYGFAILNGDLMNSEWGYLSLTELKSIKVKFLEIDRDLYWKKRPVREVRKIMQAMNRAA